MRNMIKVVLLLLIVLLATFLWPTFSGPLEMLIGIITNLFVAAGLAYVSYPALRWLKKKGLNNVFASIITLLAIVVVISLIVVLIVQLIWPQIVSLFNLIQNSSTSMKWIYDSPTLTKIYNYVSPYFDRISQVILSYIGSAGQEIFNKSTQIIGAAALIIGVYLFMLFGSQDIIDKVKIKLQKGTKKYAFFQELNIAFLKYLKSFSLTVVITAVLYGVVFYLIGHPDWLALAALSAFANLIPYFGGIIVNIIALITSIFVSQELFIAVCFCIVILPTLEGNIIYPIVYKKTIHISPIVLLPAIFVFGGLFGILGVILSIPIIIFYKVAKPFYWPDIKKIAKKIWSA